MKATRVAPLRASLVQRQIFDWFHVFPYKAHMNLNEWDSETDRLPGQLGDSCQDKTCIHTYVKRKEPELWLC